MPLSLQLTGSSKDQLAISLAALLLADASVEISAENLESALSAASVKVPAYYAPLYAAYIAKAGGVDKFTAGPSAGGAAPAAGAGAAPAGAAAPAAAKAPEKPKEEEVDALDGGMDMFGGGGGGGGDY